ncbi:MAG TPA: helix-turn-helix transcriptional regulator [Desulfobulbaceae bacterium]|nr:helix-turn-helix transcriptional regulator [Desulfobulbaceae bacterium]
MTGTNIHKVALDSISAHIAVLDRGGYILETNRAWQEFGRENGLGERSDCVGLNYLDVCLKSSKRRDDEPAAVARAIRKVMAGEIEEFFMNYPCHSPGQERWFALRIVRFREPGTNKVVLTHENITPLIRVQQTLAAKEQQVREQAEKLEESNIALKVLLQHREEDRQQLEANVLMNVRELILPYIEKLLESGVKGRERTMLEIVQERLREIISPFLNRFSSLHEFLTPQEIQVANMVREGRTSKEIADVLMISVSGVDFHRKQIRRKLQLSGSGKNLRSYLLSLQ